MKTRRWKKKKRKQLQELGIKGILASVLVDNLRKKVVEELVKEIEAEINKYKHNKRLKIP